VKYFYFDELIVVLPTTEWRLASTFVDDSVTPIKLLKSLKWKVKGKNNVKARWARKRTSSNFSSDLPFWFFRHWPTQTSRSTHWKKNWKKRDLLVLIPVPSQKQKINLFLLPKSGVPLTSFLEPLHGTGNLRTTFLLFPNGFNITL